MSDQLTVTRSFHVRRTGRGRKTLQAGIVPAPAPRIPWVAKWMALAIRFDQLLREGRVVDQAELARMGHVSRARVTQIMNLTLLAPEIQEELLFLTGDSGRVQLRSLQRIAGTIDWGEQRRLWEGIRMCLDQ